MSIGEAPGIKIIAYVFRKRYAVGKKIRSFSHESLKIKDHQI